MPASGVWLHAAMFVVSLAPLQRAATHTHDLAASGEVPGGEQPSIGSSPVFEPPVLIASSNTSRGQPTNFYAADEHNIFGFSLDGSLIHSSNGGKTWQDASHKTSFAYPMIKIGPDKAQSISAAMPLPTDDNGTAPGPRSFAAASGATVYSLTASGDLQGTPTTHAVSFVGLPHGSVATCSGYPDGGSCYCGDFGPTYGYKGIPHGRYPGDGLVFYGSTTLPDGTALVSSPVCEDGSIRNSIAVFGAVSPFTDFSFRGWATRGSDFHFQNYTTGPSEHALTVLEDGTAMLVFRNDGDGSCERPVGMYRLRRMILC